MAGRLALLIMIALAASGCSRLQLLYSFADDRIESEAAFFLVLTPARQSLLETETANLVRWHRSDMLPRYAARLRAAAARIDRGDISEKAVGEEIARIRDLLAATVEGMAPFAANVLAGYNGPDEIAHLRARFAERRAERRAELQAPPEERIDRRVRKAADRFESVLGDLSPAQRLVIRRYFMETAGGTTAWQRLREARRAAFADYLATRPEKGEIARFVPRILLHPEHIVGREYRILADGWWSRFSEWMAEVAASLSPEQRRHLSATLRAYADDMLALSTS